MIDELTNLVLEGGAIDQGQAMWLAQETDRELLYGAAHRITESMAAKRFDLCSITNVKSGLCSENCKWCSQSRHFFTDVEVYGVIDAQKCAERAQYYQKNGVSRYSLVASGRRASAGDLKRLCVNFAEVRKRVNISLCASLGLLDQGAMEELKRAGVTRYHCNLETAPSFFATLCSTHTQEEKVETIRAARRAGLEVCSGGIIGMGESVAQRVELAFMLKKLGIDSIPINILHPIVGTPLEGATPLTDEQILTTVALFRFINPRAALRFAGGRLSMSGQLQQRALYVGVNAAIAGAMLTTGGEDIENDKKMIIKMGYQL